MRSGPEEHVVLVDADDVERGTMEKIEAHRRGELHRAFSVFLFDRTGDLLLQRRATGKYHSAGLWSNSCCGHPRPGESLIAAAVRRTREELGASIRPEHAFTFTYRAQLDHGLIEHEVDHVLIGHCDGPFHPDPTEVNALRSAGTGAILREMERDPARFTAWFRICFPRVLDELDRSGRLHRA
ncbi:MAG: isopentenyl-diphosphate Delta-isomerase [Flavobacteriales bacterium]|nr:isopentenyl-diphosphate Delta-isomerase [Flavobacteriales bacterium]MCB9167439.1 isopentenyl-diphosphate Delta-isomerase [Flavobacteriales bacterium]MCB9171042.1 isopentenyl-diphosphate Delta-isomerase [Flavobacteriales bacterium]